MTVQIGIILGSTRPGANGRPLTAWIQSLIRSRETLRSSFTFIDLGQVNLPIFDEPVVPAKHPPIHAHTKAWQKRINSFDAFLFITPQYNWGYPAALKNALDFLYTEWLNKPAAIISYGGRGGGKAALQLKEVLTGLKMRVVDEMPGIKLAGEYILHGQLTQEKAASEFALYATEILQVIEELDQLAVDSKSGQ